MQYMSSIVKQNCIVVLDYKSEAVKLFGKLVQGVQSCNFVITAGASLGFTFEGFPNPT